jgi:hypothetical protein
MEETIRKMAKAIADHYIDEDKAKDVSDKLINYIGSPGWERYLNTGNVQRLMWNLNCIITNTADDGHFYLSPANGGMAPQTHNTGIDRFTPHYIKISEFVNLGDEYVRQQYMKVFAQIQDPLIIDVRDCPGGSPETTYFILSHLFPDDTPLFELVTRGSPKKLFKATSVLPFYTSYNTVKKFNGKVRILANGNTASAAESLTFVVKNTKRGEVYGSRTATHAHIKMALQVDNVLVHIPFAKTINPEDGKDWEGVGILPDFDITSKEFVDLVYKELAPNYLTPASNYMGASKPHRVGKNETRRTPNPFNPPVVKF